jgi:hypothetical protein
MLHEWEKHYPGRTEIIFQSLQNITLSHLLDGDLFDFKNLTQQVPVEDGDIVFDEPVFDEPVVDEPVVDEPVFDNPETGKQTSETQPDNAVVELKRTKS